MSFAPYSQEELEADCAVAVAAHDADLAKKIRLRQALVGFYPPAYSLEGLLAALWDSWDGYRAADFFMDTAHPHLGPLGAMSERAAAAYAAQNIEGTK